MRCALQPAQGKSAGASSTVFMDHAVLTGQDHCRSGSVSASESLAFLVGWKSPPGKTSQPPVPSGAYVEEEQSPEQAYAAASPIARLLPGSDRQRSRPICGSFHPLAMVVSGDILHATLSIMPDLACEVSCIMHWYPEPSGNRCFSRL